jgi:hypothetical protein
MSIISHKSPRKASRVNQFRDAALADGLVWAGSVFQIDERSQQLIASRALKLVKRKLLGEPVEDIQWITADNQVKTFTPDEFLEFSDAVDAKVEALILEARAAKNK